MIYSRYYLHYLLPLPDIICIVFYLLLTLQAEFYCTAYWMPYSLCAHFKKFYNSPGIYRLAVKEKQKLNTLCMHCNAHCMIAKNSFDSSPALLHKGILFLVFCLMEISHTIVIHSMMPMGTMVPANVFPGTHFFLTEHQSWPLSISVEQKVLQKSPAGITCVSSGNSHSETAASIRQCLVWNLSAFSAFIIAILQLASLSWQPFFDGTHYLFSKSRSAHKFNKTEEFIKKLILSDLLLLLFAAIAKKTLDEVPVSRN